jgi:hypothetical protein
MPRRIFGLKREKITGWKNYMVLNIHIFHPFLLLLLIIIIIIIIIIISCHRFSFFPGTSALEPVVNPTT